MEKLPPVEIGVSVVELKLAESVNYDSSAKLAENDGGSPKRRVTFNPTVSMRTFEQDDWTKSDRRNLQPQSRDGRKHRSNVNDHPWMPTGEPNPQKGTPRAFDKAPLGVP